MTAAQYEARIARALVGTTKKDAIIADWRVTRVDRSAYLGGHTVSSFHAMQPTLGGGVKVQGPDVVTVARLMSTWDAGLASLEERRAA